jgi:hypothetical protein
MGMATEQRMGAGGMASEMSARQRPEYRAALADLRSAVEARQADPGARHLLVRIRQARARVRSIERGGSAGRVALRG